MDLLLRIGGSLIGLVMVLVFLRSIVQVALINQQGGDRLARRVGRFVYRMIARVARRRRSYDKIQDVLAWIFPIYVLLLIIVWFALVQAGFALLIWSSQAEHSLLQAVIASGSALSTLGFLTPTDISGQFLAIPEGAMGLGIVVFLFTFIPGYQTAIQARELKVAWLYARVGADPANFELVEWFQRSGRLDDSDVWEDWEEWFRALAQNLTLAPVLAFVPSVHRNQTWLIAAAVMLDTALFYLSALDAKAQPAALLCHATGVNALRLIAAQIEDHRLPETARPASPHPGRPSFDAACDRLAALGAPVKSDRDECWQRFTELRREYEVFLQKLANRLLIPMHQTVLAGSDIITDRDPRRQVGRPRPR
jgi:hypothetical protein